MDNLGTVPSCHASSSSYDSAVTNGLKYAPTPASCLGDKLPACAICATDLEPTSVVARARCCGLKAIHDHCFEMSVNTSQGKCSLCRQIAVDGEVNLPAEEDPIDNDEAIAQALSSALTIPSSAPNQQELDDAAYAQALLESFKEESRQRARREEKGDGIPVAAPVNRDYDLDAALAESLRDHEEKKTPLLIYLDDLREAEAALARQDQPRRSACSAFSLSALAGAVGNLARTIGLRK